MKKKTTVIPLAAIIITIGSLAGVAMGQTLVDMNGTSQIWTSSQGATSGYPVLNGSTGISPASVDLGGGLTMSVSMSVLGTALPYTQTGNQTGNLNRLDGSDPGISASPSSPSPVANQHTGFAFSSSSEGADGNGGSLVNYLRYDFSFSEAVYLSDITITDIDALQLWNPVFSVNLPAYEDSVAMEAWAGSAGTLGTGMAMSSSIGANLVNDSIGGISFVRGVAPSGSSAATTGGLAESSDPNHHATFSTSAAVQGFSLYYFDNLDNLITYNGGMTVGIQNFTVTQIPEPSSALLLGFEVLGLLARRRK